MGMPTKMFGLPLGSMIHGSRLHCALPSNQSQLESISVRRRTPNSECIVLLEAPVWRSMTKIPHPKPSFPYNRYASTCRARS
jgi:hypothetical protein